MAPSNPTQSAIAARAALRGDARRAIERGYRLDSRAIDETAGQGVERVQRIMTSSTWSDAGWALLVIGVVLMRGDDERSVAQAITDDPMVSAGLSFGAFLGASAGDRLLEDDEQRGRDMSDPESAWQPPDGGEAVVAEAAARSAEVMAAALSTQAAQQLTTVLVARLREEAPGIDHTIAGWALSIFGTWLAGAAPQAARAVGRSRVLGRPNEHAQTGCALSGALMTSTGSAVLGGTP